MSGEVQGDLVMAYPEHTPVLHVLLELFVVFGEGGDGVGRHVGADGSEEGKAGEGWRDTRLFIRRYGRVNI